MFGLGFGEILIILVLALVLLGPQKLPEVAKQLGKGLREFRKATEDLKSQFEDEFYAEPKAARPSLVAPTPGGPSQPTPAAPAPMATAENVPGLDVACAEGASGPSEAAPTAPVESTSSKSQPSGTADAPKP